MNIKKFEDKRSLRERLNDALAKKWKLGVSLLLLVIVGMAGILLLDSYVRKQNIASAELAEDIQEAFTEWVEMQSEKRDADDNNAIEDDNNAIEDDNNAIEDEINTTEDDINALIEKAMDDFEGKFAAQRAQFTKAQMEYIKENWTQAAEQFSQFADQWNESYLAPTSLFNAASAYEEIGNMEAAKNALTKHIELYGNISPQTAEVMFSLGRIAEAENNLETAMEKYKELISRFPESRWHDLAKSRLLLLSQQ